MSLTIETGSGVAGANSYATVAEVRAYALARGLTVPTADADVETALVRACDKLESYDFKGTKTDPAQDLAWPRSDVYVYGSETALASDAIPGLLKKVQCQLATESAAGTDLQPTATGQVVVREKLDVIETEYAAGGGVAPRLTKAEEMLAPLLNSGGALELKTVRL